VTFTFLLIGHDVNPLYGIGLWAVGQRFFERNERWPKVALALLAIGAVIVVVVALLPTEANIYSRWYLKPWMNSPKITSGIAGLSDALSIPRVNAQYAILFAHDLLIMVVLVMLALALRGRFLLAKIAMVFAAVYAVAPIALQIVRFPYHAAATELPVALKLRPNRNDPSAELMTWMQREIPKGDGILGDPNRFFRLKLSARVSVDDDLLSLVPYVPATSAAVVDEFRRLYAIDFVEMARKHQRLGELFGDAAWNVARQKVLAGQIPEYQWVVEEISQRPAAFLIVYENAGYRVYSAVKR